MGLSRTKWASLVRSTAVLLCKLLLVDVVCSIPCDWLLYLVIGTSNLATKSSKRPIHYAQESSAGIQVILCGISRSGSMSLWNAMNILGFPCFHGAHLMKPTNCKLFTKAKLSGNYREWKTLLHDYRAIADFPAASAYKELLDLYPNAKVILNCRDPEKWYESFSSTFLAVANSVECEVIQPIASRCSERFLFQQILKGTARDKELSIQNYKLHVEEVKKYVPPSKLFVLELEKFKGWEELCSFLEVPIPNVPFPSVNNRDSFKEKYTKKYKFVLRFGIFSYISLIISIIIYSSIHFYST